MGITSPHRHEQKIMQMKVTSEQAKQLLTDQLSVWESARDNYKALEAVQVKELTVEGCTVKIQFNPARIVSSAAKVDTQSLKERKCFLCAENRPEVQEGLPDGSYTWLINPFPIFPEHFTIPVNEHLPQLIEKRCFVWHRPPNITYCSITALNAEHRPQIMLISKLGTKDFYLSKRS